MKNKFKKISLIVSIIAVILSFVLLFFLNKGIKDNMNIVQSLDESLQKELSKQNEVKDFNNSFKKIEQNKLLFETHFVQSSDVVPFLNNLEKMAESVNTKAEVSFIEIASDKTGLMIELKDTGTFSQVYKFVKLLENSPYEIEFVSVNMHQVDSMIKKGMWESVLKMKLISFI